MGTEHEAERTYRRRVNAWCMYDWANSAFATTILAAVLPVYYGQVAGATLPSEARATAYWSTTISVSLFIAAILSPILGTVSDVMRGKKRFLAVFVGLGVVGTGLLVMVSTGDWLLASILFLVGRVGFTAANVFYDALLPHVAREEDRDRISTRGYALGYLGGGILLAVNVIMLQVLPGTWGARISFLSVAIWWAAFSIPVFVTVPEPPAATAKVESGETVLKASFRRILGTLKHVRRYRELFKYLIAFLIYNDGIGTIISVSAIYGAELGFGSVELVLALLLVQFVGIPFSLIFGRLPDRSERRRPLFLAFIILNLISLPIVGMAGRTLLPGEVTGAPLPAYETLDDAVGEGAYVANASALAYYGGWETHVVPAEELRAQEDGAYVASDEPGAAYELTFNGQSIEIGYSSGPDRGIWAVEVDGESFAVNGEPLRIDGYHRTVRHGVRAKVIVEEPGRHTVRIVNTGERNPNSSGTKMTLTQITVLPPLRESNVLIIVAIILALEAVCAILALLLGRPVLGQVAERLDTKRSIILALIVYSVIAVWGFVLNSVIEFWFLAWMVAIVQGGSQALSRSLYASMAPAAESGEFFGLYGVMEKFAAIIGPLLFAGAAAAFDSSRPAILSLILLFVVGIYLLSRVDVEEGRRVAKMEDAELLGT